MSGTGGRNGDETGVLSALVDFGFTRYATPRLVKILYVLTFALIGLLGLFYFGAALFSGEIGLILAALVVVPLITILYLIYARVGLELLSIVFRIGEDVHRFSVANAPGTGGPVPGPGAPSGGVPWGPPGTGPSAPGAGGPGPAAPGGGGSWGPPAGPSAGGPPTR